jgi:hypothetical protein
MIHAFNYLTKICEIHITTNYRLTHFILNYNFIFFESEKTRKEVIVSYTTVTLNLIMWNIFSVHLLFYFSEIFIKYHFL